MWSSTNDDSRKLSKLKTFLGIFFFYYDLRVLHLLEEIERERERERERKHVETDIGGAVCFSRI